MRGCVISRNGPGRMAKTTYRGRGGKWVWWGECNEVSDESVCGEWLRWRWWW